MKYRRGESEKGVDNETDSKEKFVKGGQRERWNLNWKLNSRGGQWAWLCSYRGFDPQPLKSMSGYHERGRVGTKQKIKADR